jgi:hypothetical protein|tara:strand:- start:850 stop:1272 length:423 start_codon:yes stop_codon:yes gene_type:complete
VECPVCEKRIKQGFVDCEQQKSQLEAKNKRLTLALTIGLTLAGREAAAVLYEMLDTVERVVRVDPEPSRVVAYSPQPPVDRSLLRFRPAKTLFPYVPPLLPSIRENPFPEIDFAVAPDPNPMLLYGAAWWVWTPSRKRSL